MIVHLHCSGFGICVQASRTPAASIRRTRDMRIDAIITGSGIGQIEGHTRARRIGIALIIGILMGLVLWAPQYFDERSHVERITNLAARSVQEDMLADLDSDILEVIRLAKLGIFEEA